MKTAEIRGRFLSFFESKGHTVVRSSSLVPGNDPTMLFTNSGMVQFKDVFLGTDQRFYERATTVQRCVRAGGKHNDLENVGYTARHHTFFEMLGNFSFGNYFKRDAIHYAWELLTKVYGFPAKKLTVTVYIEDDEAYDIWAKEIGVPVERIIRIGDNKGARYASDNFWQMADTGPCGPCSEIFYDHGPAIWGGPPGSPEEDGDRFIEIWNLVFMQFNRDEAGVMNRLPRPCVDTGMGLERLAAVMQHVHSNYEIDLFENLILAAAQKTACEDFRNNSLKVIADHIRSAAFLVVDGVMPSSEGQGYVLRRIIRRALRHGHKLGQARPFFYLLVDDLVKEMGAAYPELFQAANRVKQVLKKEEERFCETLEQGMKLLEAVLDCSSRLDGETAFTLYDTYGFPLDLTADICRERQVVLDEEGFDAAMARQKEKARAAGKFKMIAGLSYQGDKTRFVGYETLEQDALILALYYEGQSVEALRLGQTGVVVLDITPFYAESGGQCGDAGLLQGIGGVFEVTDTQKIQSEVFGHHGQIKQGNFCVGEKIKAQVDAPRRLATMRNHSATHLLHKALRKVLGFHVVQRGSQVDFEKTRFDFSHNTALSTIQIAEVEVFVNREILTNQMVLTHMMGYDEALKHGAMALFGEKYGDVVRVLDIGSSTELCGGTHVVRTGDIGLFKIVAESSVAAGIRRIEGVSGEGALSLVQKSSQRLTDIALLLKANSDGILERIDAILEQNRLIEKELAVVRSQLNAGRSKSLAGQAVEVAGIRVLAAQLDDANTPALRQAVDQLRDQLKSAVIVLASVDSDKVCLVAAVTTDLTTRIKADELVNFVAQQLGGKGGGRVDLAQAGGNDPAKLSEALKSVIHWVSERA